MVVDAHLHCSGNERRRDVLRSLDGAKVDVAILLAPFLTEPERLADPNSLRSANAQLATLVKILLDQLLGFAVVNLLYPHAVKELQDDFAHRVYERASTLGIPIIFHSGILLTDGRDVSADQYFTKRYATTGLCGSYWLTWAGPGVMRPMPRGSST
jgi:hypothetical protein